MKKLLFVLSTAVLCFLSAAVMPACKEDDEPMVVEPTLYDTLGGTALVADPANPGKMIEKGRLGIRSVVDSTIFVIAGDSRINGFFEVLLGEVTSGNLSGFQTLSNSLTDFFCVATGAKNFTYSGMNMVDAHNPAKNGRMKGKSNNAHFDAFIDDLVKGAKQNGLPDNIIGQVGALVETLRPQVVQQ
ncbi:MAG: group 1 truncated hemoglobin [Chitinophagales bacterium]|nr:group 1 truncated hemoglobin [Chitinophagales bacterium]